MDDKPVVLTTRIRSGVTRLAEMATSALNDGAQPEREVHEEVTEALAWIVYQVARTDRERGRKRATAETPAEVKAAKRQADHDAKRQADHGAALRTMNSMADGAMATPQPTKHIEKPWPGRRA